MYLVDTDVISDMRKDEKANPGVRQFFEEADRKNVPIFISAVAVGELRQGVESMRHRGDESQARMLENWLVGVIERFDDSILSFDQ